MSGHECAVKFRSCLLPISGGWYARPGTLIAAVGSRLSKVSSAGAVSLPTNALLFDCRTRLAVPAMSMSPSPDDGDGFMLAAAPDFLFHGPAQLEDYTSTSYYTP